MAVNGKEFSVDSRPDRTLEFNLICKQLYDACFLGEELSIMFLMEKASASLQLLIVLSTVCISVYNFMLNIDK